jgi:myo-inositol-1(or 4)-monophosphatase
MAAEIGGREGKGGMVHGVRSLGSATMDLAYCAMGAIVSPIRPVCSCTNPILIYRRTFGGKVGVGKSRKIRCPANRLIRAREWDVAAGICLLQEVGGLITTANPPEDANAPIIDAKLGGRLYLAIRPAGDSESESGRQSQERTVREVWRRVRHLDYQRPGV